MPSPTVITLKAKARTNADKYAFDRLQEYCYKMNIEMSVMQINDDVVITLEGKQQQLMELEDHLEQFNV